MINMIKDFKANGGLDKSTSEKCKELVDKYKLSAIKSETCFITAEIGQYGSISIKHAAEVEDVELKYEEGSYDYVSCSVKKKEIILWTDYSDTEPYNRHGGLYADGSSFGMLGTPTVKTKEYREYHYKSNCSGSYLSSFPLYGFWFNDIYGSIKFGICIEPENVDMFIQELRKIIGK